MISVICYKFQNISLKSDFIQFFHDFISVHSPKAGADNPLGTLFLCQQEHRITLVFCYKFQKHFFEVGFYKKKKKKKKKKKNLYMYIAPG